MKHIITLPNQRQVTAGTYAAAWRAIKAKPDAFFPGWDYFPISGREILKAMRDGLHDRINRHIPQAGRKWDADAQGDLWRLARAVNTPRLIVRRQAFGPEARRIIDSRLTHRVEA